MHTVLIIDDDPLLRTLISRFLKDAENVRLVGSAETGTLGLALVKEHQPDIVILDIQLPDVDPASMTGQVKNISPRSRVYLCSAYSDERVEATVKQVHADGFVSKTNLKNSLNEMVHKEKGKAPA